MLHFMKRDSFGWYCISSTGKKSQRMKWLHKSASLTTWTIWTKYSWRQKKKKKGNLVVLCLNKAERPTVSYSFFKKRSAFLCIQPCDWVPWCLCGAHFSASTIVVLAIKRKLWGFLVSSFYPLDHLAAPILDFFSPKVEIRVWGYFYLARSCLACKCFHESFL